MILQPKQQTETRKVNRTLAIDPPMKNFVIVEKVFPGAYK